ncbi:MAG: hypothetical protein IJF76_04965, partial [Clostridia bacterium]|nr:hypothetical protein [Clostridia bacterium]
MKCCNYSDVEFLFPFDGDCLNSRDGKKGNRGLIVPVTVKTYANKDIYINSIKATESNGTYRAEVELLGYRNSILVENKTDSTHAKITVFWIQNAENVYRISSDDNVIFLQDITKNKDVYKSIFDNPYLAVYKKAHDLYGAKVHINLFYEFDDQARSLFSSPREYFNLSMTTDKFKEEFTKNSDWLKLSFHAYSEFPDKPYEHATREKITSDCIKVVKEIIRFAGPDSLSDTLTVHWGEANRECVRGLRSLGIKNFAAYFDPDDNGDYIVSYYHKENLKLCNHVHERDFFYDKREDAFFAKIDCVSNIGTLSEAMERVKNASTNPHTGGFVSVMIHEQYFHDDYINYEPDFEARVLEPAKYLYERGYRGAHVTD